MYKKLIILILFALAILNLPGCDNHETIVQRNNWKIGIMTPTVVVNEEEYIAAENVTHKYGEEHIIHMVFPVEFMAQQEATINKLTSMAYDNDVKGIIISQGIPGVSTAIDKIKEIRDDILIIVCSPGEDPDIIASKADIIFSEDVLSRSYDIVDIATKQGAKTLIHYSFPRHMSYKLLAERRDLIKEECERQGIEFVDVTTPDPGGEGGISIVQPFVMQDVLLKIDEYGKNTAFYTTSCSMDTLLGLAVSKNEAIYVDYNSLSPSHGFPEALGIEITEDKKGDTEYLVEEIKKKSAQNGMKNRISVWPVHVEMMYIEAGAAYIREYIYGNTKGKLDVDEIKDEFFAYSRLKIEMEPLKYEEKTYENYLIIELVSDFIIFVPYI